MIQKKNNPPSLNSNKKDSSSLHVATTKKNSVGQSAVKEKEKIQTFSIRLPLEVYEALRETAFKEKIKINPIIVQLIKDYLKGKNKS